MRINEDQFLGNLLPTLSYDASVIVPPGDDCAAIDIGNGRLLLLAVDQVAENSHYFGLNTPTPSNPVSVGRKLLARNLSDIAAMGGVPRYALTAIGMPLAAEASRLDDLFSGVKACAEAFGVSLIGGDLSQGPGEYASLTIVGDVDALTVCLRAHAEPGDVIFTTGRFGGSFESGRHLTFQPRLAEGKWLADGGFTRCMIDVSDGLIKDLGRICNASEVKALVNESAVPVHEGSALKGALYDGEDYELIISVNPDNADRLVREWPFETLLTAIGTFVKGEAGVYSTERQCSLKDARLYDHFSSSESAHSP